MSILVKIIISITWFFLIPIFMIIPAIYPDVGMTIFWALLTLPVIMLVLVWFNKPRWLYSKLLNKR
jgi:hypothetical protein